MVYKSELSVVHNLYMKYKDKIDLLTEKFMPPQEGDAQNLNAKRQEMEQLAAVRLGRNTVEIKNVLQWLHTLELQATEALIDCGADEHADRICRDKPDHVLVRINYRKCRYGMFLHLPCRVLDGFIR